MYNRSRPSKQKPQQHSLYSRDPTASCRVVKVMSSSGMNRLRDLLSQAVQCLNSSDSNASSSKASSSNSQPTLNQAANQVRPAILTPAQHQVIAHTNRFTVERNALFQRGSKRPPKKKSHPIIFWNHQFVCLAEKEQIKTPSTSERIKLASAG